MVARMNAARNRKMNKGRNRRSVCNGCVTANRYMHSSKCAGCFKRSATYGASSTCLQAAGSCASVIGGFGFGGVFGGFGCSTASENQ